MSKTPSWIMLGFVLGVLCTISLRKKLVVTEPPRPAEISRPAPVRRPQPLATIEAVFELWHKYAVWADDTTEVALWNSEYRDFSDFYEVRRVNNVYYYRSLTSLTRRIYQPPNLPSDSPLRFTETEEHYRDRMLGNVELRRPIYPTNPEETARMTAPPIPAQRPNLELVPEAKK